MKHEVRCEVTMEVGVLPSSSCFVCCARPLRKRKRSEDIEDRN